MGPPAAGTEEGGGKGATGTLLLKKSLAMCATASKILFTISSFNMWKSGHFHTSWMASHAVFWTVLANAAGSNPPLLWSTNMDDDMGEFTMISVLTSLSSSRHTESSAFSNTDGSLSPSGWLVSGWLVLLASCTFSCRT